MLLKLHRHLYVETAFFFSFSVTSECITWQSFGFVFTLLPEAHYGLCHIAMTLIRPGQIIDLCRMALMRPESALLQC